MYQPSYRQDSYLKDSLLHSFKEMKDILYNMSVPSLYKTGDISSPYLSSPSTRGSYYPTSSSYKSSPEQYKSVSPPRYSEPRYSEPRISNTNYNMRPNLRNSLQETPYQQRNRSPGKSHTAYAALGHNESVKRSSLSPGRISQRDSHRSSGSESIKRSINSGHPQTSQDRTTPSRKIFFDPFGERVNTVSLGSPVFLTDELRTIRTPDNVHSTQNLRFVPSPTHSRHSSHSKTVVFRTTTQENPAKGAPMTQKSFGLKNAYNTNNNGVPSTGEIKAPKRTFPKGRSTIWKDEVESVKDEGDSTPSSMRVNLARGSHTVKHSANPNARVYW